MGTYEIEALIASADAGDPVAQQTLNDLLAQALAERSYTWTEANAAGIAPARGLLTQRRSKTIASSWRCICSCCIASQSLQPSCSSGGIGRR